MVIVAMIKHREETMKTHILLAFVGLAIGFVLPTFAQDTVDPKTAKQIHALAAKFNEVFNKHDPAAVAAFYTEGRGLADVPRNILRSAAH